MNDSTRVRTYRADTPETAAKKFQLEAATLAALGYKPTSQSWAPGTYGCGASLIAFLLSFVLIGILAFIYMYFVKPEGTLTVTYEYTRGTETTAPGLGSISSSARVIRLAGPDKNTYTRMRFQPGQSVQILKVAPGFVQVCREDGAIGWIPAEYVAITRGPVAIAPAAATSTKKCPQCAEMVQGEANICRFCRYEFETAG